MWALNFDKCNILVYGIYFCWISDFISMEQHMESRLNPQPTSSFSRCTIRKHILPLIVASKGSVVYICKCKPQVSLNNYQLEILLMSSWSYSSGKNLEVNHLWVPLEAAASHQHLNTLVIADPRCWFSLFTYPAWPESGSSLVSCPWPSSFCVRGSRGSGDSAFFAGAALPTAPEVMTSTSPCNFFALTPTAYY